MADEFSIDATVLDAPEPAVSVDAIRQARDSMRRTVLCHESIAESVRDEVAKEHLDGSIRVFGTPHIEADKVYVMKGWPAGG